MRARAGEGGAMMMMILSLLRGHAGEGGVKGSGREDEGKATTTLW